MTVKYYTIIPIKIVVRKFSVMVNLLHQSGYIHRRMTCRHGTELRTTENLLFDLLNDNLL